MIASRRAALAAIVFASSSALLTRAEPSSPHLERRQVGETSPVTVTAPFDFVFTDPEATSSRKQEELAKLPVVVRVDSRAGADAEAALRADFTTARLRFRTAMEATFGKRRLAATDLETPAFRELVSKLAAELEPFPLSRLLAGSWALDQPADLVVQSWVERLRETLAGKRIRPDALPAAAWAGALQVRLVDLHFAPAEDELNGYLARFIRPNCAFDLDATARLRELRIAGLRAAVPVLKGQVLVKAGEVITPRTRALLDQMQRGAERVSPGTDRNLVTAVSALAGAMVLAGWWMFIRSRRRLVSDAVIVVDDENAVTAPADLRAGMVEVLRDEFVGALVAQRRTMLDAQDQAQRELARIEFRLQEIQAPLQERLNAYERRIGELEQELTKRGEESQELLRATIDLMQQKAAEEKSGRVTLN
jgi:membrane-associated HD superfamily phosphohydrolase